MAQNDTSKTANISFFDTPRYTRPYQRSHAANWCDENVSSVSACAVRVSFVITAILKMDMTAATNK